MLLEIRKRKEKVQHKHVPKSTKGQSSTEQEHNVHRHMLTFRNVSTLLFLQQCSSHHIVHSSVHYVLNKDKLTML